MNCRDYGVLTGDIHHAPVATLNIAQENSSDDASRPSRLHRTRRQRRQSARGVPRRSGHPGGAPPGCGIGAPLRRDGLRRHLASGAIRIFTPGSEIPFGGLPTVGVAWLLREVGTPLEVLRTPAGEVPVRYDGERTWIQARASWLPGAMRIVELGSATDVEAHLSQSMGEPWLFIWAWADEEAGRLRARSFPTDYGILEDEASGLASVVMGDRLGRQLTIHMGVGSEITVRPHDDGTIEIGGRTELVETREFAVGRSK